MNIHLTIYLIATLILALVSLVILDNVERKEEVDNTEANENNQEAFSEEEEDITNHFSLEWEKKMYDYDPGYVYMIPVKSKRTEKFYEDITKVPVNIRGAFLTDENIKDKIEFIITDPNSKLVYKNFTNECIFEFEATVPGTYKIKFRNSQSKHELKVTFTMNTYQEDILQNDHLTFTEKKIENILKFTEKIRLEEGFVRQKRKERFSSKCCLIYYFF